MKNTNEIILALLFVALLFFYLNPFGWYMLNMWQMLILIALVIVFAIFVVFVWREGKGDERDVMHRMLAGRYAFLLGIVTLLLGIILQSLQDQLDSWLVITLGVMVLTKVLGLLYNQKKF